MKYSAYIARVSVVIEYDSSVDRNIVSLVHTPLKKLAVPKTYTLLEQANIMIDYINRGRTLANKAVSLKVNKAYSIVLCADDKLTPIMTNEHLGETKRSWCYYYDVCEQKWQRNALTTTNYINNALHFIGS